MYSSGMGKNNEYPLSFRIPKDLLNLLDEFCTEYYMKRPDAIRIALITFFRAHKQAGTLLPNMLQACSPPSPPKHHAFIKASDGD